MSSSGSNLDRCSSLKQRAGAALLAGLWALPCAAGCADEEGGARTCADPTQVLALPHPGWQGAEARLTPPAGDRAVALLRDLRPAWTADLALVDGWPRRPILVLPLDGAASAVDPQQLTLYLAEQPGDSLTPIDAELEVSLEDGGHTLVVQPRDPLPPGGPEAMLLVADGAVTGAKAMPVCDPGGQPQAAYAQAAAELPSDAPAGLSLPLRLADTPADLSRLYQALQANPVLQVQEVQARTLDSFDEHAPPPEVAALLAPTAASGILSLPAYQDGDGRMSVDAEGVPEPVGTTAPGFVVALPQAGTPPYPFVLYQHGGTQQKENILPIAGPLAAAGFAVVALDLPFHGDRAPAGGGTDLDILDFDHPLRTRDNLRQAAADHLALLTGVAALNDALEPVLGVSAALDPDRAHYMGLSLGGVTGTFTFAAATDLDAAALFVGGGGYPEILSKGLFSMFVTDLTTHEGAELAALMAQVETLLDGADPIAFAAVESRAAPPRPVVFFEAVGDPVIANEATDQWARAFGAQLAEPADHSVEGMATAALPAADTFGWSDGAPLTTRLLIHAPMDEISVGERHGGLIRQPYSQQLVAHCFATLLTAGSCEVIDTDFAAH